MHRNSPTFHYVKVQQRNVLCLLLTCAAAANSHRLFPESTRLIYLFIRFMVEIRDGHNSGSGAGRDARCSTDTNHVRGKEEPKKEVVYDMHATQTITLLSTVLMALKVFPYGYKPFFLL